MNGSGSFKECPACKVFCLMKDYEQNKKGFSNWCLALWLADINPILVRVVSINLKTVKGTLRKWRSQKKWKEVENQNERKLWEKMWQQRLPQHKHG